MTKQPSTKMPTNDSLSWKFDCNVFYLDSDIHPIYQYHGKPLRFSTLKCSVILLRAYSFIYYCVLLQQRSYHFRLTT